MNNDKARAAVYALAGAYLLYMAYQIFNSRMDQGGSQYTLMLVFSIIFLILGIGLIVFGVFIMKKK